MSDMQNDSDGSSPLLGRRALLRGGAVLAAGAATGGWLLSRGAADAAIVRNAVPAVYRAPGPREQLLHLAATDGWVSMPADAPPVGAFWPDTLAPTGYNVYAFGFRDVTGMTPTQVLAQKERAQISAPILGFDQYVKAKDNAVRVTLSNLGLAVRPDLVDGHTIHWHGFTNAIPLFDGVPELSISVPIGRDFTYYYRPHLPGTYMYHCHFEDVEHVQMGMTGVLYVRPERNTTSQKFAYDHDATAYEREFTFMLTELWAEGHYRDAHIQTSDWTDYKPSFWLMNGRAYPDTLKPNINPMDSRADTNPALQSDSGASLRYNPISSLVRCNAGDRVLLRIANLGYQHHAMTLDGIPMKVVAKDASPLIGNGPDLTYETNTVEVGPGESRDVIFTAPAVASTTTFRLYDRNYAYLSNAGAAGYGGQMTEVRVSPAGTFGPQTGPNQ
jgi:FtsP/CotA-like multicopper oxidase with cupredoxin domain